MIEPATALLAGRVVFNLAALVLWGGSALLLLISDRPLRTSLWQRLSPWGVVVAALAGVATLVALPMLTASIGNDWGSALKGHMLVLVATNTLVGSAWCWQLASMLVLGAVLAVSSLRCPAGISVASALMLSTLTVSGHTALHDGLLGGLHRINDWGHLLAGGFWLGALVPVAMLLGDLKKPDMRSGATRALIHFSSIGHLAVALAVVTGMINTWLVVGSLPLDGEVLYQRLLWLKVALVGLLIMMAILNRYWLVPRLAGEAGALRNLRRISLMEIVVLVMVVALVAWFGTLSPARG